MTKLISKIILKIYKLGEDLLLMKGITITLILIAVVLVVGGILLFSNSSPSTKSTGSSGLYGQNSGVSMGPSANTTITPPATTTTTPKTYSISISGMAFSPSSLTIHVGDTITWTNIDSVAHTVTSNSGSELSSGTLAAPSSGGYYSSTTSGGSYTHTFTTAGTYAYHCSIHTSMMGTVVVQ